MRQYTAVIEFDGVERMRSRPMDLWKVKMWVGEKRQLMFNHFKNKEFKIYFLVMSSMKEKREKRKNGYLGPDGKIVKGKNLVTKTLQSSEAYYRRTYNKI